VGVFTWAGVSSIFLVDFLLLVLGGLNLLVVALSSADHLGVGDFGADLLLHLLHLQAGDIDAYLLSEGLAVLSGQVHAHLLVLGSGDGDDPVLTDGPGPLVTNFTRGLRDLRLRHHGAHFLLDGVAGLDGKLPAVAGGDLPHGLHGDLRAGLLRNLVAFCRGVTDVVGYLLARFMGGIWTVRETVR